MAVQEKQLGQLRPSGTSPVSIYSPAASTTGIPKVMFICNTSGNDVKASVYQDDDGTTYDESTAIVFDVLITKETLFEINTFLPMDNSSGNLAVQTEVANALTFTVSGMEVT